MEPKVGVFEDRLPNVLPPVFCPIDPNVGAFVDVVPIAPNVELDEPPKTGAEPNEDAPPNAGLEPNVGPPPNAGAAVGAFPVGEPPNVGAVPNECDPVLAGVDVGWPIPKPCDDTLPPPDENEPNPVVVLVPPKGEAVLLPPKIDVELLED